MPTIFLINQSTNVSDEDVSKIAAACDAQLRQHVAPVWERVAWPVQAIAKGQTIPTGGYNVVVMNDLDEADAAGWHTDDGQGIHGVVGTDVWLNNGGSVTGGANSVATCASHEVLELFCDKNANEWRDTGQGWAMIQEVCDAVEGDSYILNGVSVSNFLYPDYFDSTPPKNAKFDYLGKLRKPFSVDKGGYFVYLKEGKTGQHFAEEVPQFVKDLKQHEATRISRIIAKAGV